MKSICFYFTLQQPLQLKRYRFFEIGNDHYYYDDYVNEAKIRHLTEVCYLPANQALLEMIKNSNGKFKVSFSISGIALEQLEQYSPEVIDSFKALADTGSVEFLSETYAHSLSSIFDEEEFKVQVKKHAQKIEMLFGKNPVTFRNTELIYSDELGELVSKMGYKCMLTEGAKHILGWKSPNYIYNHPYSKLKLMTRNFKLSDDVSFRFSNWSWDQYPLTAEKYIHWIAELPEKEEFVSIGMSYTALGELNTRENGIFDFMKALPYHALMNKISFATPSEIVEKVKPADVISSPFPISWADEEKDLSAFTGNDLQNEALQKLYMVGERVRLCNDKSLQYDWMNLQSSDHFYYMCTKHFTNGSPAHYSPYDSPYEAFMNYMNVLSDFLQRVEEQYPSTIENEELNSLLKTINNQELKIIKLENQLKSLKSDDATIKPAETKKSVKKVSPAKN
ncbi:MAG: glycoside hydrolase family 57 protein [Paludibacteraceae bacterium]|nr:glycoside hydrolase family 57 protein [Paludibacteraceae bacterium]MBN2787937.1 glycoside hydrolase family 57 protein [Paludibacteraceae bacterium]